MSEIDAMNCPHNRCASERAPAGIDAETGILYWRARCLECGTEFRMGALSDALDRGYVPRKGVMKASEDGTYERSPFLD
jgi:hypothetical protein